MDDWGVPLFSETSILLSAFLLLNTYLDVFRPTHEAHPASPWRGEVCSLATDQVGAGLGKRLPWTPCGDPAGESPWTFGNQDLNFLRIQRHSWDIYGNLCEIITAEDIWCILLLDHCYFMRISVVRDGTLWWYSIDLGFYFWGNTSHPIKDKLTICRDSNPASRWNMLEHSVTRAT